MRIASQPPKLPALLTYKPLKTSFRSKGFDYEQRDRIGDVALFEQTKEGLSHVWYEVVLVQRHGDYEVAGTKVEAAETMPGTSTWGRLGWTYRDPKSARSKFDELVKTAKDKSS